jgi:L-lactate dehydrogenase complex protein LldF
MLLLNRRDAANQDLNGKAEGWGWYFWKKGMLKRSWMDVFNGKLKNLIMKKFFTKTWGENRVLPHVENESFSTQYKKNKL